MKALRLRQEGLSWVALALALVGAVVMHLPLGVSGLSPGWVIAGGSLVIIALVLVAADSFRRPRPAQAEAPAAETAGEPAAPLADMVEAARKGLNLALGLARQASEQGAYTAAVDLFEQALEIADVLEDHRAMTAIFNGRGLAFRQLGHYQQAEADYREALRLNPNLPQVHNDYAVLLKNMGRLKEAEDHYKQALRQRPNDPLAHYNYAILLGEMGRLEEAAEHHEEVLRLQPNDPEAHYNYALLLTFQGRLQEAENHYKQALDLRPNFAQAHNEYGILLESMERLKEAENHYQQVLQLRPNFAEAHNNYAILLFKTGRLADAEAHYREALRLRPGDPVSRYNYAALLTAVGRMREAEEHYREALQICETTANEAGTAVILHNWGVLAAIQQQWDESVKRLTRALDAFQKLNMPEAEITKAVEDEIKEQVMTPEREASLLRATIMTPTRSALAMAA